MIRTPHSLLAMLTAAGLLACTQPADDTVAIATAPTSESLSSAGDDEGGAEARDDLVAAALVLRQFAADPLLDATEFDVVVAGGVADIRSRTASAALWNHARDLAAIVPGVSQARMLDPMPAADGSGEELPSPELIDFDHVFAAEALLGTPTDVVLELVVDTEGSGADVERAASGDRPRTYRVEAGDSLSNIASKTLDDGMAWPRIYEINRSVIGPDPSQLRAGMELRIPQD